jgi:hypothetical protein
MVRETSELFDQGIEAFRLPASAIDGSGTESRRVMGRTAAQAEARGASSLNGRRGGLEDCGRRAEAWMLMEGFATGQRVWEQYKPACTGPKHGSAWERR